MINKNHPQFNEAVEKIKKMLKTDIGQEAFGVAFGTGVFGNFGEKDVIQKLSFFINDLNSELRKDMIGWLTPEYAKKYLNDPDIEVQEIVNRKLDITPDREYEFYYQPKEIQDDLVPQTERAPEKMSREERMKEFYINWVLKFVKYLAKYFFI